MRTLGIPEEGISSTVVGLTAVYGLVSVLEIVFVGQCEVFDCLDFLDIFPPWPQSS